MSGKGNYRAPWHNYRSRAKYMLTLKKADTTPFFGELQGDRIIPSGIGTNIKRSLAHLPQICSSIRLWQYIVMPDHVHFLLNVEKEMEEPLGNHIARLKIDANNRCGIHVFEQGFNDQIITHHRSLDVIFNYIKDNPRRLAVRKNNPYYFNRINELQIADQPCQAYGNLQLLDNPFKEQVVVHRAETIDELRQKKERWIYSAANGGVLVSPFISPAEKAARKEIEAAGGKIVLISNHPFSHREKPTGHDFDLCEQGRLLIISPLGLADALSRSTCLAMNDLAAKITAIQSN